MPACPVPLRETQEVRRWRGRERVRWPEPLLRGVLLFPVIADTQRDRAQNSPSCEGCSKAAKAEAW